jgi:hypothetical protein
MEDDRDDHDGQDDTGRKNAVAGADAAEHRTSNAGDQRNDDEDAPDTIDDRGDPGQQVDEGLGAVANPAGCVFGEIHGR